MPTAPLPDELVEFLKGPHAAVVSTVRSDGAPYSAATWYDWDDGRILLNMDAERLRLKHMRRDPRVSVTVIDLGDWYRAVTVLGRVVELHDDEGLVDIDRLSQRYRGTPYKNRERLAHHRAGRARALARALLVERQGLRRPAVAPVGDADVGVGEERLEEAGASGHASGVRTPGSSSPRTTASAASAVNVVVARRDRSCTS